MRKKILSLAALCCAMGFNPATVCAENANAAKYGYVVLGDVETLDDDEQASYNWFQKNYVETGKGNFIPASDLSSLNNYKCVMIHVDRVGIGNNVQNLPAGLGSEASVTAIRDYVKAGGNLFLNIHANMLVEAIGRTPANCRAGIFGDGNGGEGGDIWSACPYQGYDMADRIDYTGHPIYKGLELDPDLVNVWNFPPGFSLIGPGHREDHNCCWDTNAMGYDKAPNNIKPFEEDQNCRALATWSHVRDFCVSGITEFLPKDDFKGTILAIGLAAYEWNQNSGVNPYQSNIETIAKNALEYLAPEDVEAGISNVSVYNAKSNAVYNINGQRISNPTNGIYIVNGHKVVVK